MAGVLTVEAGREPNRKLAFLILGLTQDIVVVSEWQKCGLKYVM
jgi:hypothetical protein